MVFVGKRMIRLGSPGLPDIFAVRHGRFYAIELKTKTGKLRPAQEAFKYLWLKEDGCDHILARSELEMLEAMDLT
jgi:Holliday junction resolvase